MQKNHRIFLCCCYGYGVNGMAVLVIGAILPSIMEEASVSFTVAGGLLSMMAIGNLTASFLFPAAAAKLGKRAAVTVSAAVVPACLMVLTVLPPVIWMYAALFAAGVGRGAITIINNSTVNIISNNSSKELNLLHCSFAVGAFLAPFLTALLYFLGFDWRMIVYLIAALCVTSTGAYMLMEYPDTPREDSTAAASGNTKALLSVEREVPSDNNPDDNRSISNNGFLKNPAFYYLAFILFFYLGVENCINGWFVTYLKNTGVMSTTYATNMVSVTWLVIMAGRLCCAALAKQYPKKLVLLVNALSSAIFFFLLIFSSHLSTITLALIGLGFSLAGIYPTNIAEAGQYINGSTLGMSVLTAISAVGAILAPQLIGSIADRIGIVAAVSLLSVNVIILLILALIYYKKVSHPRN